jgi:hypothetical protein
MDLRRMMKQAQEMQQKMQEEVATLEVETTVGGGMVNVRMSGNKQLLSLRIDAEALDPADPEMLQDLIVSAVNEAGRKVEQELQSRLGAMPGLGGLFGG